MILLFLLPFIRPRPGAAARAPADRDDRRHPHDRRDGLPDLPGRRRRLAELDRHEGRARSTRRASSWPPSRAASPATRSARTATTGPGPHLTDIGDKLPKAAIRRTLENPTAPMPSFARPARGQEGRAGRLPRAAQGRAADAGAVARRDGRPLGHARGGSGPGDVRSHRRRLRPHELGHDGGAAPPLARARGRPRARRAGRRGRSTSRPAPATWRSSSRARGGGEVVGSDFSEGCSSGRARRRPALRWEQAQRAGAALRRRRVRRGDRRLRRAQLLRPRARAARDGARGAAGRPRRRARDHDAARSRRCRRSSRCGSIASCRCSGRFDEAYTLPAELGEALPGPAGARRRCWPPPGCATCAGSSPPAGSSRCTPGRCA